MKQLHLNAKNCSKRGVRLVPLTAEQCESLLLANAKLLGPEGTMVDLQVLTQKDGVRLMIKEVTEPVEDLGGATWKKVDLVSGDGSQFSKYFNAKDDKILTRLYRELHEATEDEVNFVSGKALEVVAD